MVYPGLFEGDDAQRVGFTGAVGEAAFGNHNGVPARRQIGFAQGP